MDDKDAQLRGKLEDLFSDLSKSIQAEAGAQRAAPLKSTPERTPGADRQLAGQPLAALRTLAENATDAILLSDLAGRVTFSNRVCCDLLGYNYVQKEMVGLETTALWPDEERVRLTGEVLPQALAGEWHGRIMQRRKDGSLVRASLTIFPVPDEQEQPIAVVTIIRDLTEHKQAEETLVQERSLLRTLIDNLPDLIYVKDSQSRFVIANQAQARLLGGTTPDDLLGKTDFDFFPHELAQKYYSDEQGILQSGQPQISLEEPTVDPAGNKKWLATTKVPLRDSNGQITGFVGVGRDITGRKQAEEALRESEEKYRTILENMQEGYFEVDLAGNFTFFNDALYRILGYPRDELMGRNNREYMDAENAKAVYRLFNEVYRTKRPSPTFNYEVFRKDGTKRSIEVSVSLMTDSTGEPVGFHGIVRDITERKQAEEALRESEEKYRTILENMREGYFEVDPTGNFTFLNDALGRILGYPRDELMGMNNREYMDAENAKAVYRVFNEIYRTRRPSPTFNYEVFSKDRTRRSVEVSASLMTDSTGEPIGFHGIMHDITERMRAEKMLERRAMQLQTAAEVSRAANSILTIDELLPQVVNLVRARFDLYYAGLFLVDEIGQWAVLRAGTGEAGRKMLETGHKLEVGGASMIGWCIANQKARIALDVGKEATRFSNPLLPLTRSEMALPLVSRDRVIGAMTIQSDQPVAFTQEDINVLQTMADQTANAIENARLFEQTRAAHQQAEVHLREMQMLQQVIQAASSTLDLERVLDALFNVLAQQMGFTFIVLNLIDESANELRTVRATGLARGMNGLVRPLDQMQNDIVLQVARKGQIEVIDGWDDRFDREVYEREGHAALVRAFVPLLLQEKPIGALEAGYNRQERAVITPEEVRLLGILASQIAVAIGNVRLFEAAQRRATREQLSAAVMTRMRETLDIDTVLQTAIREIGDAMGIAEVEVRLAPSAASRQ